MLPASALNIAKAQLIIKLKENFLPDTRRFTLPAMKIQAFLTPFLPFLHNQHN
jgi:hypothetical protein